LPALFLGPFVACQFSRNTAQLGGVSAKYYAKYCSHYDDRCAAVEMKLGAKEIEKTAKYLTQLKNKVNTDKMCNPSFLMILTATKLAY